MRKFKIGDRVELDQNAAPHLHHNLPGLDATARHLVGRTWVIERFCKMGFVYLVDGPDDNNQGIGYLPSRFRLVPPNSQPQPAAPEFIIALYKDGEYLPAEKPRVCSSEAQAHHVAKSMADKHGGRFVVFQAIAFAETPERPAAQIVRLV